MIVAVALTPAVTVPAEAVAPAPESATIASAVAVTVPADDVAPAPVIATMALAAAVTVPAADVAAAPVIVAVAFVPPPADTIARMICRALYTPNPLEAAYALASPPTKALFQARPETIIAFGAAVPEL